MHKYTKLLAGSVLILLTSGCTTTVYERPAQPPIREEVILPRPVWAAVWVPGHWQWRPRRGEYVWVTGHWRRQY